MSQQKLYGEEGLTAFLKETLVLLAWHCIVYDILLILVNELLYVLVGFGTSETFGGYLLLGLAFSVMGVNEGDVTSLIVVLIKLLHFQTIYKGHVGFEEYFDPVLHVNIQPFFDLNCKLFILKYHTRL